MGKIVNAQWLFEHLQDDNLCIVDASWHLPPTGRDGRSEYEDAHIPGAVYFDIDACSTPGPLPHTMPDADLFSNYVGELGITESSRIVVYDSVGWFSAARVWWMFRHFGAHDVSVLDAGLKGWRAKQFPVESGTVSPEKKVFQAGTASPESAFGLANCERVLRASESGDAKILDARAASRFNALEAEPRPGLRSGHIPSSQNIPFPELINQGEMKSDEDLKSIFSAYGITVDTPVITSCGSGVTAAILIFALNRIGISDLSLYDGSWTEWGSSETLPIET